MRQMIKGLLAAMAVTTAGVAPAAACGYGGCCTGYVNPCATAYVPAYSYSYSGCGTCGASWGYERLAEPTTQYYYVNQGPTYSGPGAFAPYGSYEEEALPAVGYGHSYRPYGYGYRHHGYGYGYGWHHRPWHRYGYAPRHYGYRWGGEGTYYGRPLVRRYY
jgi:hypothetical protein